MSAFPLFIFGFASIFCMLCVFSTQEGETVFFVERSIYLYGTAGQILQGEGYQNLTAASKLHCARKCFSDRGCFSINCSDGVSRCELNGASATRFPSALSRWSGTSYYGQEKVHYAKKQILKNCERFLFLKTVSILRLYIFEMIYHFKIIQRKTKTVSEQKKR